MSDKYLRRLHFLFECGKTKVGLDAFIEIWKQTAGFKAAGLFFSLPIIYQLATLAYEVFSLLLFYKFKVTRFINDDI